MENVTEEKPAEQRKPVPVKRMIILAVALVAFLLVTNPALLPFLSAETKQSMLCAANRRILALDGSKFDKVSFVKIADLDGIDTVVTNQKPSAAWLQYFEKHHISCIYPKGRI